MSAYKDWLLDNEDTLREAWTEHLSNMQDASSHVRMLANSDKAFEEYCESAYEDQQGDGPEPDDTRGILEIVTEMKRLSDAILKPGGGAS